MAAVYPFLPLTIVSILTVLGLANPTGFTSGLDRCRAGDDPLFSGGLYLLARLPRLGLSFGPVKPPFFMLAILRLLPFPLALAMIAASTCLLAADRGGVSDGCFSRYFPMDGLPGDVH